MLQDPYISEVNLALQFLSSLIPGRLEGFAMAAPLDDYASADEQNTGA